MLSPSAAQEVEHPLRSDPLNDLPDAVPPPSRAARALPSPPRTPPRRAAPPAAPEPPPPAPSPPHPPPPPPSPPPLQQQQQLVEEVSRLLHARPTVDDPLLLHLAQSAPRPQPPPAGRAYAADIHAALAALDDAARETRADGVMDRSDVALFPVAAQRGAPAGLFLVRSRRTWAPPAAPSPHDYYLAPRSIADFLWLHDCLRARNEGVIVPLLPPRGVAGRLRHGFAYERERLRGLQTFLRRVAAHAVLSTREELLAFLGVLGEREWRKVRREAVSHESSITSALFGSAADESALHRLARWGEKMLWQAGRRANKALVWFLERDDGAEGVVQDSPEARVERLHSYVKELGDSLSSLRHAVEKVHKLRDAERNSAVAMQNALRELGMREGGKLGAQLECVTLEIPSEAQCNAGAVSLGNSFSSALNAVDGSAGADAATVGSLAPVLDPSLALQNSSSSRGERDPSASEPTLQARRVSFASQDAFRLVDNTHSTDEVSADDQAPSAVAITLPIARVVDDVFRDYEERAKGAQKIMNARREEQDAYEHAVAVYTKLRDKLESRTGSMWDGRTEVSNEGLEGLKTEVHRASNRLKEVRERYKKVALSTTDELRRLRNDMHEDLCEALHGMAVEYARQHAAQAEAWESLSHCVNEFRKSSKTNPTSSPSSGSASRSRS